jgi:hypothetical protein
MTMKKQKETNPMYDAWRKQRGDWGSVNPVTKIVPNKKKTTRLKHPKRDLGKED